MAQHTTSSRTHIEVDGAAIRRRRHELGETITSLAPRVPMAAGYLAQLERGARISMGPPLYKRLCRALRVKTDALRAREDVPS